MGRPLKYLQRTAIILQKTKVQTLLVSSVPQPLNNAYFITAPVPAEVTILAYLER